jgi:hypothetical protein
MTFDIYIHRLHNKAYNIIIYITWFLYVVIALGLSANAPQYLEDMQYYVKMYVSLFLIYRFNPFRRVTFTGLDAKIAFSSGVFLLATTAINNVLQKYITDLKQYLTFLKVN